MAIACMASLTVSRHSCRSKLTMAALHVLLELSFDDMHSSADRLAQCLQMQGSSLFLTGPHLSRDPKGHHTNSAAIMAVGLPSHCERRTHWHTAESSAYLALNRQGSKQTRIKQRCSFSSVEGNSRKCIWTINGLVMSRRLGWDVQDRRWPSECVRACAQHARSRQVQQSAALSQAPGRAPTAASEQRGAAGSHKVTSSLSFEFY